MKEGKKNMGLKLATAIVILLFSATIVVSEEITDLTTMDYLESDIVAIDGNITLVFVNSTTGTNEIRFLWRIYSTDSNVTIYGISSKEIQYDHRFVNNTKGYLFRDNKTNATYRIRIDYSSIHVPKSLEDWLNESLIVKNTIIANLTEQVTRLNTSVVNLTILVDMYKTAWELQQAENGPLRNQIMNLSLLLNNSRNTTSDLRVQFYLAEDDISSLESTVTQLKDGWALGYSYRGKDYGPHINLASFTIGFLVCFFLIVFLSKKVIGNKIKKQTKKNATGDIEKPRQHSVWRGLLRTDYGRNKREDIPYSTPKSFTEVDEKKPQEPEQPKLRSDFDTISNEINKIINERDKDDRAFA